jgi:hypothetical protein
MLNLLIGLSVVSASYPDNYNKVLLSEVQTLSLQKNKFTAGRRNPPISQLNCEDGYCNNGPHNMMCENVGRSDNDFVWKCTGYGLTPGYMLGRADVSCEGYDHPDDPYILVGSCGVFFTVKKDPSYVNNVPSYVNNIPYTTTTTTTISDYDYGYYYGYYHDYPTINALFVLMLIFMMLAIVSTRSVFYDRYYPAHETIYSEPRYTWYYPSTWRYYPHGPSYFSGPRHVTTSVTTTTGGPVNSSSSSSAGSTTSTTSGGTRRR